MVSKKLLSFIVLLIVFAFSFSVFGWEQSKTNSGEIGLKWEESCLTWTLLEQDIDNSNFENPVQPLITFEEIQEAVRASFNTWDEVDCSYLDFVELSPSHCMDIGYHRSVGNANRIFFRQEGWLDYDAPWRQELQIGLTSAFYDTSNGRIFDVDIEFNAEYFEFTTTTENPRADIQNSLTHELGHFFGLAHSNEQRATMYASAPEGDLEKRDLHQDDIDGICHIYDVDDDPENCPDPEDGLDLECEHAQQCSDPIDGIVSMCTFPELVCCCEHAGGLGPCSWQNATDCREATGHATLQLNEEVACRGDAPGMGYTCCCIITISEGATCDWQLFGECESAGGVPGRAVDQMMLCGSPPNGDNGCGCTVANTQDDSPLVNLFLSLLSI